jgi:hypothetical protein
MMVLCVGGCKDGQRLDVPTRGGFFEVIDDTNRKLTDVDKLREEEYYKRQIYRVYPFSAGNLILNMAIPSGMRIEYAVEKLFSGYKPK